MEKILIGFDTEYNEPNEKHYGLMIASFCEEGGKPFSAWVYNNPNKKQRLADWLEARKDTHIFVSHNASAEAGALLALGLNPREYTWIDTMVEYKQAANSYNPLAYGWINQKATDERRAYWKQSVPLFEAKDLDMADDLFGEDREIEVKRRQAKQKNEGKDNSQVTASLVNCLKNALDVDLGSDQKDGNLELILQRKAEYTAEEQARLKTYAEGDVNYLIPLWHSLQQTQMKRSKQSADTIFKRATWRGRAAANAAIYGRNGIPINLTRWRNLLANKPVVLNEVFNHFQEKVFPIYEFDRKLGRYKSSPNQAMATPWIQQLEKDLKIKWPTSSRGYSFSTADGSPLTEFDEKHPDITAYNQIQKLGSGLKAHATEEEAIERHRQGKKTFSDAMCSEANLHPYFNIYGTQTGRNAPAATGFIFAQAGWLRGLIDPPEGEVIIEQDYSSQESWIAAVVSKDPELIKAYLSGDVYLAFAKSAGAVPQSATKSSHKDMRNLFKSTVLGLSYGMGAVKLAIKLSMDMGRVVTLAEAKEMIRLHREVYYVYYEWKDEIWSQYRDDRKVLTIWDGWYLDTHNPSKMSVLNFLLQGAGSAMMRVAIDLMLDHGIKVVAPVHDSFVYRCKVAEIESHTAKVAWCMEQAAEKVLGRPGMRVGDPDIVGAGEYWYTDKNRSNLEKYSKYFESVIPAEAQTSLESFLLEAV